MEILINNVKKALADASTIKVMLDSLSITTDGIAIAVNNGVIPRTQWGEYVLREGDAVTIIKATQGG